MESSDYFQNLVGTNRSNFSLLYLIGPKRDSLAVVIPVTAVYVIIFLSGLIGNISTCVVIARNKSMHTATNYYLFSLAISDLLLLISGLPQEVYSIWSRYPYIFGHTFCVLRGLFAETSANATVLTITAFTVERYLAICHPFLSHTMSKLSRAIKFILIIWSFAIFFAIPQALQFGVSDLIPGVPETETCQVARIIIPHSFEVSSFMFFVAPMSLITVLYVLIALRLKSSNKMKKSSGDSNRSIKLTNKSSVKQKQLKSSRRVLKMLVAVVVAFFVCWAPFHTQRLVAIYYTIPTDQEGYQKVLKVYEIVTYISGVLYYLSTTINPLLYNIMSNKFREAFKETFSRCCQLACFKSQRQRCSYSILPRSLRRGAESRTESSTGRDDTSVQTHISLTHKISQESMNISLGSQRSSLKKKHSHSNNDNSKQNVFDKPIPEIDLDYSSKTGNKDNSLVLIQFWRGIIKRNTSKPQKESQPISRITGEAHFNISGGRIYKKQDSTSSCDISNTSLKNVDRALLEEELANYLCY